MASAARLDAVFEALGPRGPYQMMQMAVALSPTFPAAIQLLSNVFTCFNVEHQCLPPPANSSVYTRFPNVSLQIHQCSIDVLSDGQLVETQACQYGMDYMGVDKSISALSEFDLVCGRSHLAKLSQSLVIVGQGIGAVLTSIASEKFGRKTVLIMANIGLLVCGLAIAAAPHVAVFMAFKFITGCFQQGILTGKYTFNSELFPTQHRHLNAVFGSIAWGLAVMLLPLLSWLTSGQSWRVTQAAYCTTNLTLLLQFFLLDESLRWLLANGRPEAAAAVLTRAARLNKVPLAKVMLALEGATDDGPDHVTDDDTLQAHVHARKEERMNLWDIFRIRRLLTNALAIWFAWFTTALSFFAIYLTSFDLAGDKYINFFLIATMEMPRAAFFYFFQGRLGRRPTTGVCFAFVALGLLVRGVVRSQDPGESWNWVILLATMVGMAGSSGCFGAVFSYTPELFPTNIRNQALGLSSFMGRIGGMLAPFTADLAALAIWAPGVLIGLCAVLVCLLLCALPETAGRELPQTMAELRQWYSHTPTAHAHGGGDGGGGGGGGGGGVEDGETVALKPTSDFQGRTTSM